ncbi:serine/threonine protein kinase [Myxococcus stipitatus DSM 14675]|uniref:Serine/threonine protein kinase n=1 Tax=Myxococcus stipitatus (strain DSM 14675 / JCM 12634 / Mx s8) TaxID=1278073 RepID=L7TZW5_MYXSD|nr:serine/threonine-protein kinase [Myxococcus stipitatus]AGC41518.1 serine/threonine protein kinase [Myxococcus stipitatus DSM 14675]
MQLCPQESTLTDLLSGLLAGEQRIQVLAHAETCSDCRWVLAAGGEGEVQVTDAPASVGESPFQSLASGTRISRYIVREKLGTGAMGVVYAADDPELGRRIALKMLRPEGSHKAKLQQRLLREAQSLARLSHPNVVTLFDVGTHGDAIFLAMELIEGITLKEWMQRRHPWEEVLRVFLDAGQGLEAAHSAGLVHRDFKPANVLMRNDGRVFVTDFGIARSLDQDSEEDSESSNSVELKHPPTAPLTQTGQILGTPAYLAPELVHGQRGDARSDEFSYCVTLYEALFGERPFHGHTLQELAEAAGRGQVNPPKDRGPVPPHVLRALRQGLSARPEDRFPSMRALLPALAPPPSKKHARILGTMLLAGVIGAIATFFVTEERRQATCALEAEKSMVAWGPARREQVRSAFFATGTSYAPRAWSELATSLDAYTAQWRALRTEACVATKGSEALKAQQTSACLDARLWQLAAITEVLQKADATTVQNTRQFTSSLEGLSSCRDLQGASNRPQPSDSLRPQVDLARNKLAQIQAHQLARRFPDGLALSSALIEDQKTIGYKPLEAEVLLAHGTLLGHLGKTKEAETFLYQSLWTAESARDDETVARVWLEILWLEGKEKQISLAEAEKVIQHARAAVGRLGRERFPDITTDLYSHSASLRQMHGQFAEAEEEALQGLEFTRRHAGFAYRLPNLYHALGQTYSAQGRYHESLAYHGKALELLEFLMGPDHPSLVTSYNRVATASMSVGRRTQAIRAWTKALALQEATPTPETSPLGTTLMNIAQVARIDGQPEEARRLFERALGLFESARGPNHLSVIQVLTLQAVLFNEMGQDTQALSVATEALTRVQRSLGPETPHSVFPQAVRGQIHTKARRYSEARRDLLAALAREEKGHGPEGRRMVEVLLPLAELALATKSPRASLAYCERALRVAEKTQGRDSMEAASALSCAGEAHLTMGAAAQAHPLLERARRIQTQWGEVRDPLVAGSTAFLLARAYTETPTAPEREKALAMAEEARGRLASVGNRGQEALRKVEAWQRRETLLAENRP